MSYEKTGKRLIELRGAKTPEEVSEAVGITKESLSAYENGQRLPNDAVKLNFAKYFGVSVDSIFLEE